MGLLEMNASLSYSRIAPLLGMEDIGQYEAAARCPYCQEYAWRVYPDARSLEEWHFCSQCKASGSVIAMAAEKLQMTEADTIRYLSEQLQLDISPSDVREYCELQDILRKFHTFWDECESNLLYASYEERMWLRSLRWMPKSNADPDSIQNGMATLVRVGDPWQVPRLLKSIRLRKTEPMAVVPFYRRPDLIGGHLLVTPSREHFLSACRKYQRANSDIGFSGYQLLPRMQSSTLILTSMTTNALRLHNRNFAVSNIPLPLMSWRPYNSITPPRQWTSLDGKQLVFWEASPTAATLSQAMMLNARMAFVGPLASRRKSLAPARWKSWVAQETATGICDRIVRMSEPYEVALKNWIKIVPDAVKEKLLYDAEKYNESVAALVRGVCGDKVAMQVSRFVRVTPQHPRTQETYGGQTTIAERGGKWYGLNDRVRLNGIMRITHIIIRPGRPREYAGWVKSGDKKATFNVPIKKATMKWLTDFGLDNGMSLEGDPRLRDCEQLQTRCFNPFDVALRLSQPEILQGKSRVGWDGDGFQLKRVYVSKGKYRQLPPYCMPDDAPGPDKNNSTSTFSAAEASLMRTGTEMEITWAAIVAVCAQVTAPAVGMQAMGIGLIRSRTDAFLRTLYSRLAIEPGHYTDWPHRWPRWLHHWGKATSLDSTGFYMTRCSHTQEETGLIIVRANDSRLKPNGISLQLDKILMRYLRYFTTLSPKSNGDWERWIHYTHKQLMTLLDSVDTWELRHCTDRIRLI